MFNRRESPLKMKATSKKMRHNYADAAERRKSAQSPFLAAGLFDLNLSQESI